MDLLKKLGATSVLMAALGTSSAFVVGCEEEPFDNDAGDAIEDAVDDTGDAVEDLGENVEDAAR